MLQVALDTTPHEIKVNAQEAVALNTGMPASDPLRWGAALGAAGALTIIARKIVGKNFQRLMEKTTLETLAELEGSMSRIES